MPLSLSLVASGFLFAIGVLGVMRHKRNMLAVFMSVELILLSAMINFAVFSVFLKDRVGQIFALFIIAIAAAEAAIGLSLFIAYFRHKGKI